ncbi:MAG: response regulator [Treponema sp.]|nr:response regulator [Treponema sp.]
MGRIRTKILALAAGFLIFSTGAFPAVTKVADNDVDLEDKNVLFLTSSDASEKYYQTQINCFTSQLPSNYRIYSKFINSDTNLNSELFRLFYNFYNERVALPEINFIIAADNSALDFIQQSQYDFFKGVPIVALGIERGQRYDSAMRMSNIHVVLDEPYVEENIKLINSLFPRRRKIVFIGNNERQERLIDAVKIKFDIESEFKNISGLSRYQLVDYAKSIDKSSILFLPSSSDLNYNLVKSDEAVKILANNSENPIFTCHDICFGEGILGGYFVSQEKICESAVFIFKNLGFYKRMANTYGVNQPLTPEYFFDAVQMKKFNITKSSLNVKTIYINDNQNFVNSRNRLITLLIIMALLLTAIAILSVMFINRVKGLETLVGEERSKLNAIVSQSDALFWECYFDRGEDEIFLADDYPEDSDGSFTGDIAQGWIDSGIIPEEYLDKYNEMIGELKAGKESVSIDLPLLQEDIHTHLTTTRWKHIVYKIIEKKGDKVTKAIATAIDITNRKHAEEEYEGEMSYRSFINKEYPLYTRLNLTSNVIMEKMVNVPELSRAMVDTTSDNELEAIASIATTHGQNSNLPAAMTRKQLLTMFMNGNRSKEWDFYYEFKTGIIRWFSLSVELTSNPHTNCIEANIYLRDITNTKIMSISKDSVLDEEVEYIFWLDLSTANCHFIHSAQNISWLPADRDNVEYYSMIETMLNDVVSSKDRPQVEDFFALKYLTVKLKDKQAANCTFEIITDNLRIAIKQVHSYFLNGNQNIIVFICRDITDITLFEKLQNEKLSKAIEQAEKANASKSDFLSRMSHDLRTPMNGVIGIAELAEDELDKPEAIKEDLRKIKSSSKYMVSLLNDILDMSKIESGKLEIRKSKSSVGEMLEFICTQAQTLCESKKIEFYCNRDPKLLMHYLVNVDKMHLQQIVMNLLSNASKFTPPQGRIEFLINILSKTDEKLSLELIVRDTGSGMTKEFQKVMFDAFTQDVNSINKQGTGLGLSIVNNLVRLMDGTIKCDSAPGEGTTFTINLDVEIVEAVYGATEQPSEEKKRTELIDLTGKKILLVEDNALNQEISRRILQKNGMEVTIAENGLVALDRFSESAVGEYDLVLMDVMMPVMGGIESAGHLRNIEREDAKVIPIVALTANAFQEDIQKCLDAGMNTHLSKPINPVLLIQTISDLIRERQAAVNS